MFAVKDVVHQLSCERKTDGDSWKEEGGVFLKADGSSSRKFDAVIPSIGTTSLQGPPQADGTLITRLAVSRYVFPRQMIRHSFTMVLVGPLTPGANDVLQTRSDLR